MVTVLNKFGCDISSCYDYAADRNLCEQVFSQLIPMLPEEIDVSEKLVAPNGNLYNLQTGQLSVELEDKYERLLKDKKVIGSDDEWTIIVDATIKILAAQVNENDILYPKTITFEDVEKIVRRDYLGWKGEEPEGVTENSVITIDQDTGEILSIKNP